MMTVRHSQGSVLSILLSIEPGRLWHPGIAKAAKSCDPSGFSVILVEQMRAEAQALIDSGFLT